MVIRIAYLLVLLTAFAGASADRTTPGVQASLCSGAEQRLLQAFERQRSNILVCGTGVVVQLLADDNRGSRHQRFIVRLASGQTVLIAHNIDLAPRLEGLREGETVAFLGEYEWNPKGGVVHWTHHDPKGNRRGGWLRYRGSLYR